jgi:hypothetical protein
VRLSVSGLAALALSSCAGPEAPALSPRLLAVEDWSVFAEADPRGRLCWIAAEPVISAFEPAGEAAGRGRVLLMTAFPAGSVEPEVSYMAGWPLGGGATLTVDGASYALFPRGATAWVHDPRRELDLIDDLRRGRVATARSVSSEGRAAIDRFSLAGYDEALQEAARRCV